MPNPNPDLVFVVHNELITKNGILNHENLDFTELIKDKVSEFVYVFAPLRIKGATGSRRPPDRDRLAHILRSGADRRPRSALPASSGPTPRSG